MMDDYDDVAGDKHWAKKYILDPLHCPEPSQECGPGTSFRDPDGIQRSLSTRTKAPNQAKQPADRFKPLPTLPTPTSPKRTRFRPRRPPSQPPCPPDSNTSRSRYLPDEDTEEDVFRLHKFLSRSLSVSEGKPPFTSEQRRQFPPSTSLNRSKTVHTAYPRETKWNRGTILTRQSSVASNRSRPTTPRSQTGRGSPSSIVPSPVDSPLASPVRSPVASPMASPVARNMDNDRGGGLRRSGSLTARNPGDMSDRPLDVIKRQHRAAMRAPYLHNPHHKQPNDPIDSLDLSGPVDVPYHHDGPFDATMASRNRKKRYSPLEAVKDSNEEAMKATPREFIQDSLTKHVPLQGTAVIPPGMNDFSGRTMEYEEGADLMRESDAPGGAYKRYEGIRYRDDDLKGKGEPSYTFEREHKEQKVGRRQAESQNEGHSQANGIPRNANGSARKDHGAQVRQRSVSNVDRVAQPGPSSPLMHHNASPRDAGLRRRNTTGNRFAEGLRRRLGSLRRKMIPSDSY